MGTKMNIQTTRCVVVMWLLLTLLSEKVCGKACAPKEYGPGKIVCVCNATYCDDVQPPEDLLKPGHYLQYTSTQTGKRLELKAEPFSKTAPTSGSVWTVNKAVQYQEIIGIGAAVTDSVGVNLSKLDEETRKILLEQYYGANGIGYSIVRVPMGGTDFSPRFYTYDDGPVDLGLTGFKLAEEDYEYKLPHLKYIKQLSDPKVLMTPWSPPLWMIEDRNGTVGFTRLKDEYYQVCAEYFVKSLEGYQAEGIDIWAVTPQNEPGDGYSDYFYIPSCGYSPDEERKFIANNLCPTLKKHNLGDVVIMNSDDQRTSVGERQKVIMSDSQAYECVQGTALHWYFDNNKPASVLTELHDMFQDKFILYTEASFIKEPNLPAVLLGDWGRAEILVKDIIEVFNHRVSGWIDWNLALNTDGGPTYLNNNLDSPIIVNTTANEFYKQPMYYGLGHLSKFVIPGSKYIQLNTTDSDIDTVAFLRPDRAVVVVLLNSNNDTRSTTLQTDSGTYIPLTLSEHSLNTIIYTTSEVKEHVN